MIAALAAASGVYFTGLSLEATRTQNAVAEQAQLTDRFTSAVNQLDRAGANHLQGRLGAIYALERLAHDSPRDHPTVVEVLAAFIRTTTPKPLPFCPEPEIAPDIQAALTVLGRRNTAHDGPDRINLWRLCLPRADLSSADLSGTNLTFTDLTSAMLPNADLTGADLTGAKLTAADLVDADLAEAKLTAADLSVATLSGATLAGADLSGAILPGADLSGADLTSANLTGAIIHRADFTGARHDMRTDLSNVFSDRDTRGVWW